MKHLEEYCSETSPYELFEHLYTKIINRELLRFSQLMDYVQELPRSSQLDAVYAKAFGLIRELNWGRFSPLNPQRYPALWKELVVPHRGISGAGELKRNTSISSVYTAIVDIHGYSAFCYKFRRNPSMLQLLDDCIRDDIHRLCAEQQVISWRIEGDSLVLLAADARGIARTVVKIIEYFSRQRVIKGAELFRSNVSNKIVLPDMAVSAGIAGGKTYTSMVITSDGDISGDIVNTAARLQSFANRLDPHHTRVLLSNHLAHQIKKRPAGNPDDDLSGTDVFFLGRFRFKGMELTVFELLYRPDQQSKLTYQKDLVRLINALRKGLWRDQVFTSMIGVIRQALHQTRAKSVADISRQDLLSSCDIALERYNSGRQYREAIHMLETLLSAMEQIRGLDGVIPIYGNQVLRGYQMISRRFYENLENEFEESLQRYLDMSQRDLYKKAGQSSIVHQRIKEQGLRQMLDASQKYAWHRLIDEESHALEQEIYIPKN